MSNIQNTSKCHTARRNARYGLPEGREEQEEGMLVGIRGDLIKDDKEMNEIKGLIT